MSTTHPARPSEDPAASAEPRLPHEHDESTDSQQQVRVQPRMHQAHEDLRAGRQDTDRGKPADAAYEKQKGQGVAGTQTASPDASGAGVHKTDAGHGPGDRKSASGPTERR